MGATWDCHRLLSLAGEKEDTSPTPPSEDGRYTPTRQAKLAETFYRDFHNGSQDLSSRPYLIKAAHAHGLFDSEEAAQKWLESDEHFRELKQKLQIADMLGVRSIPFIVVADGADHMSEVGLRMSSAEV